MLLYNHMTVILSGEGYGTVPLPSSINCLFSHPLLIRFSFLLIQGKSKITLPKITMHGKTNARTKFGGV